MRWPWSRKRGKKSPARRAVTPRPVPAYPTWRVLPVLSPATAPFRLLNRPMVTVLRTPLPLRHVQAPREKAPRGVIEGLVRPLGALTDPAVSQVDDEKSWAEPEVPPETLPERPLRRAAVIENVAEHPVLSHAAAAYVGEPRTVYRKVRDLTGVPEWLAPFVDEIEEDGDDFPRVSRELYESDAAPVVLDSWQPQAPAVRTDVTRPETMRRRRVGLGQPMSRPGGTPFVPPFDEEGADEEDLFDGGGDTVAHLAEPAAGQPVAAGVPASAPTDGPVGAFYRAAPVPEHVRIPARSVLTLPVLRPSRGTAGREPMTHRPRVDLTPAREEERVRVRRSASATADLSHPSRPDGGGANQSEDDAATPPQRGERPWRSGDAGQGDVVPPDIVEDFRRRHGVDLSHVVIHRGPEVSVVAKRYGARAFTRGGEVYLPSEVGDLTLPAARALLAHELTHVVQQAHAPSVSADTDGDIHRWEEEARAAELRYDTAQVSAPHDAPLRREVVPLRPLTGERVQFAFGDRAPQKTYEDFEQEELERHNRAAEIPSSGLTKLVVPDAALRARARAAHELHQREAGGRQLAELAASDVDFARERDEIGALRQMETADDYEGELRLALAVMQYRRYGLLLDEADEEEFLGAGYHERKSRLENAAVRSVVRKSGGSAASPAPLSVVRDWRPRADPALAQRAGGQVPSGTPAVSSSPEPPSGGTGATAGVTSSAPPAGWRRWLGLDEPSAGDSRPSTPDAPAAGARELPGTGVALAMPAPQAAPPAGWRAWLGLDTAPVRPAQPARAALPADWRERLGLDVPSQAPVVTALPTVLRSSPQPEASRPGVDMSGLTSPAGIVPAAPALAYPAHVLTDLRRSAPSVPLVPLTTPSPSRGATAEDLRRRIDEIGDPRRMDTEADFQGELNLLLETMVNRRFGADQIDEDEQYLGSDHQERSVELAELQRQLAELRDQVEGTRGAGPGSAVGTAVAGPGPLPVQERPAGPPARDDLAVDSLDDKAVNALAERMYSRLRSRLRHELILDRERAGRLADGR
ncbi:eCIS core domain-containing protein [Lentzea sp. E54]|uniref:eCIS core domain-containing protein n=1 Tax=Lentzea xerophila TaxID=3435883 RepID=UPI003DA343C8